MHPLDTFEFIDFPNILTQCPKCGKYLTAITQRHLQSESCKTNSIRRNDLLAYHNLVQIAETSPPFRIGDENIKYVDTFEYLGRTLSKDDSDNMAIFSRLQKTRKVWGQFSQLLQGIGANAQTMGRFYRTIIHATLLFGSATWVPSTADINRLERFQARCARYMTHQHIHQQSDGTWIYPHTSDVLAACQLHPVQIYINRRKSRLHKRYVQDSQLLAKCSSLPPTNRFRAWWNHASFES
jgi:L-rhamnose mutarotase